MSIFDRHSRKTLIAILIPLAFGCKPEGPMNDIELSERMTKESSNRAAVIYMNNGNTTQGFFVALHADSLEWHEGKTMQTERHTLAVDLVSKVLVQGPIPYLAPVAGAGGFALGGCAACFTQVAGDDGNITSKTTVATALGGIAGGALGYGIGLLADPGRTEDAWVYKIRKPNK